MTAAAPGRAARHDALLRAAGPFLLILLVVLAVNLPSLAHLVVTDPLVLRSGLGKVTKGGSVAGVYSLDPNDAYTSLALEHRAALDWVHGQLPLWVGQEGLGAPLLAEGQSAALSPLSLLTLLPQGLLLQHMCCELIAGWATYGLGRQLGFARWLGTFAGVLFAVNGTFAWLGNAVVNPVCYLPVLLLGIERIRAGRRHGAAVLAAGMLFSLVAGFPEVSGIDLLFAAVWALARLPGAVSWVRMALRCLAGAVVGAMLSAPAWLAFDRNLPDAYVGGHTSEIAYRHLGHAAFSTLGLPYVLGNTDEYASQHGFLASMWGDVGGYLTATVVVLAVVGLMARDAPRLLRIGLGGWLAVTLARTFGSHLAEQLLAHVPEISRSAFYRYSPPSVELAAVVLAAYGLRELQRTRGTSRAWLPRLSIVIAAAGLALVYLGVRPSLHAILPHGPGALELLQLAAALVAVVAAFAVTWRWRVQLPFAAVVAFALAEAVGSFVLPELAAPRAAELRTAPVSYLQSHAEDSRVFVVSGVASNFGAYYGFRMLDVNDLPIPTLWRQTYMSQLEPTDTGYIFPLPRTRPGQLTDAQQLQQREAAYEAVGVGYVEAKARSSLPQDATVVFRGDGVLIATLPSPRALVSAAAGGPCTAVGQEYGTFHVDCAAPATIRVLQLDLPGWTARVRGVPAAVRRDPAGPWQLVAVPAGESTVVMRYWAPGLSEGLVLAAVGAGGGLALWNIAGLRRLTARVLGGTMSP